MPNNSIFTSLVFPHHWQQFSTPNHSPQFKYHLS